MGGHENLQLNQWIAAFGALAFLGTAALLLASIASVAGAQILGEARLKRWSGTVSEWLFRGRGLRGKICAVAVVLVAGYGATLAAFSLSSREYTLKPGEEKYFCEIDCHLAYSVPSVELAAEVGGERARGTYYVVTLKTRFDETTISPRRGDGPLQPSPREISLVDESGRAIPIATEAQRALEVTSSAGKVLDTPLRPGESYLTRLVFDVPAAAGNLRMFVASPSSPSWLGALIIGEENSVLHKKTFLALPSPKVDLQ